MQPRRLHFVFKSARHLAASPLASLKADMVTSKFWNFKGLFGVIGVYTYKRITY